MNRPQTLMANGEGNQLSNYRVWVYTSDIRGAGDPAAPCSYWRRPSLCDELLCVLCCCRRTQLPLLPAAGTDANVSLELLGTKATLPARRLDSSANGAFDNLLNPSCQY